MFLSPRERVGYEVVWLHRTDWEVDVLLGYLKRIKGEILGFVRETVLKLANAAEDTCPICFKFAIFLAHAEFDREPVDSCKP